MDAISLGFSLRSLLAMLSPDRPDATQWSRRRALAKLLLAVILVCGHVFALPPLQAAAKERESPARPLASFVFRRDASHICIPVRVGEMERQFLIDTGFAVTMLDRSLRHLLGEPKRERAFVGTDGKEVTLPLFEPIPLVAGGFSLSSDTLWGVMDLQQFREAFGIELYGIIGMDILRSHRIRIDWDAGRFDFLDYLPPDRGTPIPLSYKNGGVPVVRVDLASVKGCTFDVDTGCAVGIEGYLDPRTFDALARAGEISDIKVSASMALSGVSGRRGGSLRRFSLAGFEHRNLQFGEASYGILGLGYLSRYVATFDFPNRILYLKKGSQFDSPSAGDFGAFQFRGINEGAVIGEKRGQVEKWREIGTGVVKTPGLFFSTHN